MTTKPFKIAVLISGGGTTLKNLIHLQTKGELEAEIDFVISSSSKATGLNYATEAEIQTAVIRKEGETQQQSENFSNDIFTLLDQRNVDLVVMGGFLKHLLIPERYLKKTINIHPSLIPAFSGKGFYGNRVHQAVIDYGCKLSGCTVHFVDNQFDHGPIIAQTAVNVLADDAAETLQKRVFGVECQLLPWVINQFANGKVTVDGRTIQTEAHPQFR